MSITGRTFIRFQIGVKQIYNCDDYHDEIIYYYIWDQLQLLAG